MARQKNDGRGRMGGRAKGTPNKDKILKTLLRTHSERYFDSNVRVENAEDAALLGVPVGSVVSRFDLDLMAMDAKDRVNAELQALNYHTPKMQATQMDLTTNIDTEGIEERLSRLAAENER